MELKYVVPSLNAEVLLSQRVQLWEVAAYLEGLRQGGAIREYHIPTYGGKGAQTFHVFIEPSDESKRDLIDTTLRTKYKAIPELVPQSV